MPNRGRRRGGNAPTALVGTIAAESSIVTLAAKTGDAAFTSTLQLSNGSAGKVAGFHVGTITYSAGGTGWLTGTIDGDNLLTLTCTPTALSAAAYTATVPITDALASNSPYNITVTLTVSAGTLLPHLTLSTTSLAFTGTAGGAVTAAQSVAVTNSGGGTLSWDVGTVSQTWISAVEEGLSTIVYVTCNPGALAAGVHTGTIQVTATGATGTPQLIQVSFAVSQAASVTMGASPASIAFSAVVGTSSPAAATVTITGTAALAGPTVSEDVAAAWLAESAITGSGTSWTFTVTPTLGALAVGTYSVNLVIADATAVNDVTIPVVFDVTTAPPVQATNVAPIYTLPTFTFYDANSDLVEITPGSGLDTPYNEPTTIVNVTDQGTRAANQTALQGAINTAAALSTGTRIVCTAGVDYGEIILKARPNGPSDDWIYIVSSARANLPLPSDGRTSGATTNRVRSTDAADMFILSVTTTLGKGISIANGTAKISKYRIVGAEVKPNSSSVLVNNLVYLSTDTGTGVAANYPTDIVIDRCYVHGVVANSNGTLIGVRTDGERIKVVDSWISGMARPGAETKAILTSNYAKQHAIQNCYLEGAFLSRMVGGGDPPVAGHVFSDIYEDRCHYARRYEWNKEHPLYDGTYTGALNNNKNAWESKIGERICVQRFVAENVWAGGQNGMAIVLKAENQDGGTIGAHVYCKDVTLRHFALYNVFGGISFAGYLNTALTDLNAQKLQRVDIHSGVIALGSAADYGAGGATGFFHVPFFIGNDNGAIRIKRISTVSADMAYGGVGLSGTSDSDDLTLTDCVLTGGNWNQGVASTYKGGGEQNPGGQNEGRDVYNTYCTLTTITRNGLYQPSFTYTTAKRATLEPEHVVLNNTASSAVFTSYNSADPAGSNYTVAHTSFTTIGESSTAAGADWSNLFTHLTGVRN